jgi:1-acyl-sn-glycerol-3-phosphate acyltransferase
MKYLLASIRFAIFVFITLFLYLVWFVGSFVIPNKLFWWQMLFRLWAISFIKIAGVEVEVIGTPPRPSFFLVCNHLGYVDIPLLRAIVDAVFVEKKKLKTDSWQDESLAIWKQFLLIERITVIF